MVAEDKPFVFRPYVPADLNFIGSSWGNSYYMGNDANGLLSPDEFHAFHRPIRERFFTRPTATIIVCVAKENPDLIIGWIALESLPLSQTIVLHYLYVKQAFKAESIATELLNYIPGDGTRPVVCSHMTEKVQRILRNNHEKYKRFRYLPHIC